MARRHRILMCAPQFFAVSYAINPWMAGEEGEVSRLRAQAQWETLRTTLASAAYVELLKPVAGLPDMVFTANAGVVYHGRVIVSRFGPEQRRAEEALFRSWFEEHDFEVIAWPQDLVFEGAGDALLDRGQDWVWSGYGQRTQQAAHAELANFYSDREVISLRLIDPRYYHIDTCLQPLDGGYVIYFPGAFDTAGCAEIERRVPLSRRIAVNADEAEAFACNAVNLGKSVVLNQPSERLRRTLEEKGFEVTGVDLSEFLKSGGSAKCLVLRLDEP